MIMFVPFPDRFIISFYRMTEYPFTNLMIFNCDYFLKDRFLYHARDDD